LQHGERAFFDALTFTWLPTSTTFPSAAYTFPALARRVAVPLLALMMIVATTSVKTGPLSRVGRLNDATKTRAPPTRAVNTMGCCISPLFLDDTRRRVP
jgi:hypothetical protein